MEAHVKVTRRKENAIIRMALLVTALPFLALGVTLLPVIGLLIGFALGGIALSPWQESPLRVIQVLIGRSGKADSGAADGQTQPGTIPVTVLSASQGQGDDSDFDTSRIDAETVRFGPQALKPVRKTGSAKESGGNGGASERVFYFVADAARLGGEDQTVCITGETTTGEAFRGCGKLAADAP